MAPSLARVPSREHTHAEPPPDQRPRGSPPGQIIDDVVIVWATRSIGEPTRALLDLAGPGSLLIVPGEELAEDLQVAFRFLGMGEV